MKLNQLFALAVGGLLLLNSCKKEDAVQEDCPVLPVEAIDLVGWDASPYCFATPVAGGQYQTYVINSAAELQTLNHCTTAPTIDFARYTLLIGKTKTAACSSVKTQRVMRRCAQYTFEVELAAGLCQASTEVLYYTLVPKLAAGEQVTISVTLPR
jgi:hypothetical protein